jgi:hypothetical protein
MVNEVVESVYLHVWPSNRIARELPAVLQMRHGGVLCLAEFSLLDVPRGAPRYFEALMTRYAVATLTLLLLLSATDAWAQTSDIFVPREVQSAYESGTRSDDGRPGPAYWQNGADYRMHIRFDPESGELVGSETITYRNESPDSLRSLVLKLMPNLFKRGSARDGGIAPEDVSDGVTLTSIVMNGEPLDPAPGGDQVSHFLNGNIVAIRGPVAPGSTTTLSIEWRQIVNRGSHGRSGAVDSTSWFNAYFFPRIAVRDDIDGWDSTPHLGTAEFYNDFGDFDVTIEVPQDFVVWATGLLQNPEEVLAPGIASRYRAALESDEMVHIVDSTALEAGGITAAPPGGTNSWRFRAEYVPDFAFAVSDHYLWDASSLVVDPATGRRVLIDAAYSPESADFYEVAEVARNSIDYMSREFPGVPFPYPQETVFNGLSEMEFPMMVNDVSVEDRQYMISLTSHEIFHTYFPFWMGTNEIKYAWMDEGWATFGDYFITNRLYTDAPMPLFGMDVYEAESGGWNDLPIMAGAGQARNPAYFLAAYPKPAYLYLLLRDMWGEERFGEIIREYMERWNGKHPTPWDFFNTLEDVSGEDLAWLIRPWFFEYGAPDLALGDVHRDDDVYRVEVLRAGANPVPIDLSLTWDDDSQTVLHEPVSVWRDGSRSHLFEVPARGEIRDITLGLTGTPDANPANNAYLPEE